MCVRVCYCVCVCTCLCADVCVFCVRVCETENTSNFLLKAIHRKFISIECFQNTLLSVPYLQIIITQCTTTIVA